MENPNQQLLEENQLVSDSNANKREENNSNMNEVSTTLVGEQSFVSFENTSNDNVRRKEINNGVFYNEISETRNTTNLDTDQIIKKIDNEKVTSCNKSIEESGSILVTNIKNAVNYEKKNTENSTLTNFCSEQTTPSEEENSSKQETMHYSNNEFFNTDVNIMNGKNQLNDVDEESEEILLEDERDNAMPASQESLFVIKDDKCSDSDVKSEDTRTNLEETDVNINSNSQFYEGSDSKLDYAVKIDDNDNDTLSEIEDIKTDSAADSEDSALGSMPPDVALNEREEEGQDRSDGSDSGLGSETTEDVKISNFSLDLPCTSGLNASEPSLDINMDETTDKPKNNYEPDRYITQPVRPQKSSLKRKFESDGLGDTQAKKKKEGLRFDKVTVYYFPRAQGFNCVPSQGGSTLGMERQHSHMQHFTLAEHAIEQRRLHRQILQQLKNERHSLQGVSLSSSEESDTEEEASDMSESELDLDSYYFLQPVPTRQRRALLRAAGVRKIEAYEKDECRDIRTSREFCGCACKGSCNPESCSCSLAGIKCQVDRLNFPCGCTRDCCKNTTGRIEFNPIRVRTHFIHTLMRIGLEKKNEEEAAKRQWAETAQAVNNPCSTNTVFETNRSHNHEDGLVRDVNLTPRVEVESCVNTGSFSNIHCDMNNTSAASSSMQGDMSYTYRAGGVNDQTVMQIAETGRNHHADPYSASMLQGKGPPYSLPNNMGFETVQHNIQRFPCDVNYTYGTHENHHFKSLQSFSASSFEEFANAHSSHMAMIGNYGHYAQEYLHKHSAPHSMQYHHMAHNHYDMYKTSESSVDNKDSYYAPLMSLPYHTSKVPAVDDENWFSQNTLMAVEEPTQDAPELPPAPAATPVPATNPTPSDEATENFGELIKKTMVESVSV